MDRGVVSSLPSGLDSTGMGVMSVKVHWVPAGRAWRGRVESATDTLTIRIVRSLKVGHIRSERTRSDWLTVAVWWREVQPGPQIHRGPVEHLACVAGRTPPEALSRDAVVFPRGKAAVFLFADRGKAAGKPLRMIH